jgi:hypothetical protein
MSKPRKSACTKREVEKCKEQLIDLTKLPKPTKKVHPQMSTTPERTRLGEIPSYSGRKNDSRGTPIGRSDTQAEELTKEKESARQKKQERDVLQLQADNPKLRGSVSTTKKVELKKARKALDDASRTYMELWRLQTYGD